VAAAQVRGRCRSGRYSRTRVCRDLVRGDDERCGGGRSRAEAFHADFPKPHSIGHDARDNDSEAVDENVADPENVTQADAYSNTDANADIDLPLSTLLLR